MKMNMMQNEWMGKDVKVIKAANASLVGISGIVVDETKEFIMVETANGVKKVSKANAVFIINGQTVEGSMVHVAPQERLKIKVN